MWWNTGKELVYFIGPMTELSSL